ncbi:MAG: O-antigen ligase family protein [Candidatus Doudnabacteria bacterium]|jgi:O-antigen ligase
MKKFIQWTFFSLVVLSLTASWWVFKDLLFPYVTSKAFFFRICIELALPLYVYLLLENKQLRPNWKNPLHLSVMAFFVINVISAFSGVDVIRSLWGNFERMGGAFYLGHLTLLYFYVVALGQMPGSYFQKFLKLFLAVAAVVAVNGLFGWMHLPMLIQDPSLPARVSSTLGNPIYLGSFALVPMFISIFFALQAEHIASKSGYFVLAFVFFLAGFLSGTRGALVGLLVGSFLGAVAYLIFSQNKRIKIIGLGGVVVALVVAGIMFNFSDRLPVGSVARRIFTLKDSNTEARLLQWQVALRGYKDRPLLGTGPENYYIVANQYYNPEIYKYDRSWFDKPHNYIIEILVTNGIIGLIPYLLMLGFCVVGLYKGMRAQILSLGEFSILLAVLIAYQIQNLTVFDNVSSSVTFYVFLGFVGYIYQISVQNNSRDKKKEKNLSSLGALPVVASGVAAVVVLYVVYAANFAPMSAAKNINYGFAYANVDPNKALDYFEYMASLPFNFDKTESANRYADFANIAVRNLATKDQALAVKILNKAISYAESTVEVQGKYSITWQRLGGLYIMRNVNDPKAEAAAKMAIELAPNREEPYMNLVQIRAAQGKYKEAEKILIDLEKKFPTDFVLKTQQAVLYRMQNKLLEATTVMEQAFAEGYDFVSYSEVSWMTEYYISAKQLNKALALQERAVKIDPNNVQVYVGLARIYAIMGNFDKARTIVASIKTTDPELQQNLKKFVESFPK